jgi:hypothetical protein
MLSQDANPVLQQTEQKMQAKVPPQFQSAFQKIIAAGEKVMYSPQTRQMTIAQLKKPGDPAQVIGAAVAKLYGVLASQSKGTMPPQAGIPAITVLLCEALDFAEKAKLVKVTPQVLAQATHALMASLMQLMGVDQKKLALMAQNAQQRQAQQGQPAQPTQPAQPAAQPAGGLVAQAQGAA